MKAAFATKTKLVFFPMLYLSLSFFAGYLFFYWLFHIRLNWLLLNEDLVQLWLPMGFSFLLVLVIIRPRIHLLKLDKDNGKLRGLYYLIGAAVLFLPVMTGVQFLEKAVGKLTMLQNTHEFLSKPKTKYYKLENIHPDKRHFGLARSTSYSGKHNQYLNYRLYFAIPLLRNEGDTLNAPVAYVSAKYTEQISSKLNGEERVAAWRKFWDKSMQEFEQSIISFSYLEQYGKNDDRRFLEEAATKCRLYSNRQPIFILKPIREPFEQRTGKKGQQLFLFFFIGLVVWFSMIQIPGLHEIKARRFTVRANSTLRQIQETWCTIRPRPGFAATPVLISVNIALFLFMVFAGLGVMNFYGNDLVDWGAIYKPHLVKGQWWRLFTYQFLHGGLAHITMNMIGLCLAGIILEPFLEKWRFLFGYLTAGLAAGIVSLWWHKQPIVTVGASGAIFGLYGMLLAMVVFRVFDVSTNRLLIVLLICTSGFGLLMGWLTSGIDNSAHIGGLIAGFIIGVYYVKTRKAYVTEEKWEVKKKGVEDWI